jgi:NADPH:quinone reductase-like Zn-dependent oxidoreductase
MAVQLAANARGHVIGTASAYNEKYLRGLGVDTAVTAARGPHAPKGRPVAEGYIPVQGLARGVEQGGSAEQAPDRRGQGQSSGSSS